MDSIRKYSAIFVFAAVCSFGWSQTVAVWGFNEKDGTTASDATGKSHEASIINASSPVFINSDNTENDGKWGNEVRLNGNNAHIELGSAKELSLNGSFTLESWFQTKHINEYGRIFSLSSAGKETLAVWFRNSNTVQFVINFGGQKVVAQWQGTESLADGKYHHIAVTFDAAKRRMAVYVDGVKGSLEPYTPQDQKLNCEGTLVLGARKTSSTPDCGFSGDVDEVRISSAALQRGEMGYYKGPLVDAATNRLAAAKK